MNIELTEKEQNMLRTVWAGAAIIFGVCTLILITYFVATPKPKVETQQTTNMYLFLFTSQGTNGTFTGNYRAKLSRVTAGDFDQVQNLLSAQDTNRIWRVFNVLRFDE